MFERNFNLRSKCFAKCNLQPTKNDQIEFEMDDKINISLKLLDQLKKGFNE